MERSPNNVASSQRLEHVWGQNKHDDQFRATTSEWSSADHAECSAEFIRASHAVHYKCVADCNKNFNEAKFCFLSNKAYYWPRLHVAKMQNVYAGNFPDKKHIPR